MVSEFRGLKAWSLDVGALGSGPETTALLWGSVFATLAQPLQGD